MGFNIRVPVGYEVISENADQIILGFRPALQENPIPTLTFNRDRIISYESLLKCSNPRHPPCLEEITDITLDGKPAKYIKVFMIDASYHLVVANNPTTVPQEIKMWVGGPGLSDTFAQILSTFRYIK